MNHVIPDEIAQKVIAGIYDGVTTRELDILASEICAQLASSHPDYGKLAARISISNLHKETDKSFAQVVAKLYEHRHNGKPAPLVSQALYDTVMANTEIIESEIIYDRDFHYTYFGFKTLEKSYLKKIDNIIVERPQHMLMRVSLGIHGNDIQAALQTYEFMSKRYFTHATPTLFNAGTVNPACSSCFLLGTGDSLLDLMKTVTDCAVISKNAGGIGFHLSNVRAAGSYIASSGGKSNGLVPLLRIFNDVSRWADQSSRRPGAFAAYLEPWHADVFEFLELKYNEGKEELRARDLFYALWIPDLFMKRVENNENWTLMCPNECKGLSDVYGDDFENLYTKYENAKMGRVTIPAQKLWQRILDAQTRYGGPFLLFKDAANKKSNQKNLGTIKSSNLCTEIIEYSSLDETACCNLSSIALPMFFKGEKPFSKESFDYKMLGEITRMLVRNLNKVIDVNFYPTAASELSNKRHRPIGIGVQGLADCFMKIDEPFDSENSRHLNKKIFETIYYYALDESAEQAKIFGAYDTFQKGYGDRGACPAANGILQPDMWDLKYPEDYLTAVDLDWVALKQKIKESGLRNSLLIAPMPTASTSQILGNTESIDPLTSNIYVRKVISGEFQVVNESLTSKLVDLNLWDKDGEMKDRIIAASGSIQNIDEIPEKIRMIYRTVWELPQRSLIDMAADRGAFICQSQSLNLFLAKPTFGRLTSMYFHAWRAGLKTGVYYTRQKAASDGLKFALQNNKEKVKSVKTPSEPTIDEIPEIIMCSLANPESCLSCGS